MTNVKTTINKKAKLVTTEITEKALKKLIKKSCKANRISKREAMRVEMDRLFNATRRGLSDYLNVDEFKFDFIIGNPASPGIWYDVK